MKPCVLRVHTAQNAKGRPWLFPLHRIKAGAVQTLTCINQHCGVMRELLDTKWPEFCFKEINTKSSNNANLSSFVQIGQERMVNENCTAC